MTEQNDTLETAEHPEPKAPPKRDIIRFNGDKPTALNLEHVTSLYLEENRITFEFYTKAQFVDFENKETASSVFEALLTTWATGKK